MFKSALKRIAKSMHIDLIEEEEVFNVLDKSLESHVKSIMDVALTYAKHSGRKKVVKEDIELALRFGGGP
jgi:histone H3/H4